MNSSHASAPPERFTLLLDPRDRDRLLELAKQNQRSAGGEMRVALHRHLEAQAKRRERGHAA